MLQDVYLVYPDQFAINARMFKTIILYYTKNNKKTDKIWSRMTSITTVSHAILRSRCTNGSRALKWLQMGWFIDYHTEWPDSDCD